jgi:hypothetical protein
MASQASKVYSHRTVVSHSNTNSREGKERKKKEECTPETLVY